MLGSLYLQTCKSLLTQTYNKVDLASLVVFPVWFTWEGWHPKARENSQVFNSFPNVMRMEVNLHRDILLISGQWQYGCTSVEMDLPRRTQAHRKQKEGAVLKILLTPIVWILTKNAFTFILFPVSHTQGFNVFTSAANWCIPSKLHFMPESMVFSFSSHFNLLASVSIVKYSIFLHPLSVTATFFPLEMLPGVINIYLFQSIALWHLSKD